MTRRAIEVLSLRLSHRLSWFLSRAALRSTPFSVPERGTRYVVLPQYAIKSRSSTPINTQYFSRISAFGVRFSCYSIHRPFSNSWETLSLHRLMNFSRKGNFIVGKHLLHTCYDLSVSRTYLKIIPFLIMDYFALIIGSLMESRVVSLRATFISWWPQSPWHKCKVQSIVSFGCVARCFLSRLQDTIKSILAFHQQVRSNFKTPQVDCFPIV
jgi:hypothetical protein